MVPEYYDNTTILYFYFILIAILIYLYIHTVKNRLLIIGIISILSSSTLVISLINYISNLFTYICYIFC
jgi:hypothetical protein